MEPFKNHTGLVAAMDRSNVDTDQIIPKQFLKRIERTGFGQFLFFDWRFLDSGEPNTEFELNQSEVEGASILLARHNFGSGSSREHAVWALADYGIRALLAPSYADIFYNNCFKNGVLPVQLTETDIETLFQKCAAGPLTLTIDLEACSVSDGADFTQQFEVNLGSKAQSAERTRRYCALAATCRRNFQVTSRKIRSPASDNPSISWRLQFRPPINQVAACPMHEG